MKASKFLCGWALAYKVSRVSGKSCTTFIHFYSEFVAVKSRRGDCGGATCPDKGKNFGCLEQQNCWKQKKHHASSSSSSWRQRIQHFGSRSVVAIVGWRNAAILPWPTAHKTSMKKSPKQTHKQQHQHQQRS